MVGFGSETEKKRPDHIIYTLEINGNTWIICVPDKQRSIYEEHKVAYRLQSNTRSLEYTIPEGQAARFNRTNHSETLFSLTKLLALNYQEIYQFLSNPYLIEDVDIQINVAFGDHLNQVIAVRNANPLIPGFMLVEIRDKIDPKYTEISNLEAIPQAFPSWNLAQTAFQFANKSLQVVMNLPGFNNSKNDAHIQISPLPITLRPEFTETSNTFEIEASADFYNLITRLNELRLQIKQPFGLVFLPNNRIGVITTKPVWAVEAVLENQKIEDYCSVNNLDIELFDQCLRDISKVMGVAMYEAVGNLIVDKTSAITSLLHFWETENTNTLIPGLTALLLVFGLHSNPNFQVSDWSPSILAKTFGEELKRRTSLFGYYARNVTKILTPQHLIAYNTISQTV